MPKDVKENVTETCEVFYFFCTPVVHKMEKSIGLNEYKKIA